MHPILFARVEGLLLYPPPLAPWPLDASRTIIEVLLRTPAAHHEVLMAELLDLGAEAFAEEDNVLRAYLPATAWSETRREAVRTVLQTADPDGMMDVREVPAQNWNTAWEASVTPVLIEPFLITPTWRPVPDPPEDVHVLQIDPKMSFGTGHHETTRLMLQLMPAHVPAEARVMDAGSGTGVLAIAAVRLGAAAVVAFDIDPRTEDNIRENVTRNGVAHQVEALIGTLTATPPGPYDVILANINLNTLVAYLPRFVERLAPGGHLLLSGLLTTDRDAIRQATEGLPLTASADATEGDWWAVAFTRTPDGASPGSPPRTSPQQN